MSEKRPLDEELAISNPVVVDVTADDVIAATPPSRPAGNRIAANAAAGLTANVVKTGLQLVMLPLMAHLLGPAEFGLYALAMPAVSFFLALADGGLGTSMAREDENETLVWSTAFWFLLASGIIMTLVVSGWGLALSILAHEPRLFGIMSFLSIAVLMITMSVLPSARLTRRGNLVAFAGVDVSAAVAGAVVAVVLAARGAGAWSLAAQYVTVFATRAVFLNALAFHAPHRRFALQGLKRHLSTGSSVLGSRLAEFGTRLVENLVFGNTFGAAALGAYTFANQTPRFLCEAVSNPIWITLYAEALHHDPQQANILYAKLVRLLGSVLLPIMTIGAVVVPYALTALLGAKWVTAAPLLQILMPCYALNTIGGIGGAILLANGRNAITFGLITGNGIGRVIAVTAGLWLGPIGVACGVGLSNVLFAIGMFAATSKTGGSWQSAGGLIAPLIASIAGAATCYVALKLISFGFAGVGICTAIGIASYFVAMLALEGQRFRSDIDDLKRLVLRRAIRRSVS